MSQSQGTTLMNLMILIDLTVCACWFNVSVADILSCD